MVFTSLSAVFRIIRQTYPIPARLRGMYKEGTLAAPIGMTGRKALDDIFRIHSSRWQIELWVAELCPDRDRQVIGVNAMYAYCLFCNTVRRGELAAAIRQVLGIEVIAPKIIQRKWVKGRAIEDIHDYLPGYLFLYAEKPIEDLAPLFRMEGLLRVLGERDQDFCLSGSDLAFAEMLRRCGGTLGVLKTCREGDRVRLADGAMGGVDGEIIRLDRRGRALVRFGFDGKSIQSWVAIEMIEGSAELIPKTANDAQTDS